MEGLRLWEGTGQAGRTACRGEMTSIRAVLVADGNYKSYVAGSRTGGSVSLGAVLAQEECYQDFGWNWLYSWGPGTCQACVNSISGTLGGTITVTSDRNGNAYVRVYNGGSATIASAQLQNCNGVFIGFIGERNGQSWRGQDASVRDTKGLLCCLVGRVRTNSGTLSRNRRVKKTT